MLCGNVAKLVKGENIGDLMSINSNPGAVVSGDPFSPSAPMAKKERKEKEKKIEMNDFQSDLRVNTLLVSMQLVPVAG